jgi:hypothetical protein
MVAAPISPIDCLRELAAALEREEVPPAPVRSRFVAALRRIEREGADGLSLDAALGLSPSAWRRESRCQRNAIICEAHGRYLNGVSLREAGKHIIRIGRELQSGRRQSATDDLTRLLRGALAVGVPFPTSSRQVENILRGRAK